MTAALAQAAARVAGIDISLEMLARARGRNASGVWLVAADMRRLPFNGEFDLIAASSDPLCHLADESERRATLEGVASRLAANGRFVLDALYRPPGAPAVRRRRIVLPDGTLSIRESWSPLSERNLWRARYRFRHRTAFGTRTAEASFTARGWDPDELRPFFRSCGLAVEEVWGSFSGETFCEKSAHLIVVARRRLRHLVAGKRQTIARSRQAPDTSTNLHSRRR